MASRPGGGGGGGTFITSTRVDNAYVVLRFSCQECVFPYKFRFTIQA